MIRESKSVGIWVSQASWFKTLLPIAITAARMGCEVTINLISSGKWNCATSEKNLKTLTSIAAQHNMRIRRSDFQASDVDFFVEGRHIEKSIARKKVSLIENDSYVIRIDGRMSGSSPTLYETYIDKVDHVVFPSSKFADHYGLVSEKHLFLGHPQFDSEFSIEDEEIIQCLGLIRSEKRALIILPKLKYLDQVDLLRIIDVLRETGHTIVTKTRGKDKYTDRRVLGDQYFDDMTTPVSWLPYTTPMLLQVSDVAINFGSTAILECIMKQTPVIDFDIKSFRNFPFLYESDAVSVFKDAKNFDRDALAHEIATRTRGHMKPLFDKMIDDLGISDQGVSRRILHHVL
jgi:hypothetical protein